MDRTKQRLWALKQAVEVLRQAIALAEFDRQVARQERDNRGTRRREQACESQVRKYYKAKKVIQAMIWEVFE